MPPSSPASPRRRFARVLLSLLAFGFIAWAAIIWLATSHLLSPSRRKLQPYHQVILDDPERSGMSLRQGSSAGPASALTHCLICEPHAPPSAKGQKLRGSLSQSGLKLPEAGKIIGTLVLLHGHTGRKEDHLPVAERLCAVGFRCLLLDLPGHGDSPLPHATFGQTEAPLPALVLREQGYANAWCGLFGLSQGGAIALQAAALDPAQWQAVAEISSFASLHDVIDHNARRRLGLLAPFLVQPIEWLSRQRAGLDPQRLSPEAACRALPVSLPIFIGHGEQDRFVPPAHAQRLFEALASPTKQRLRIADADHHNVLITPAPVYATLARFFLEAQQPGSR